jgi:hypothetical protein
MSLHRNSLYLIYKINKRWLSIEIKILQAIADKKTLRRGPSNHNFKETYKTFSGSG